MVLDVLVGSLRDWSLFSLAGLAFVLVFKTTGVFNLAQGHLMLLTVYVAYSLQTVIGSSWVVLLCVLAIQVPLGVALGVLLRQSVKRRSLWAAAVVTLGLGIALEGVFSWVWGSGSYQLASPLPESYLSIGGARLTVLELALVGLALAAMAATLSWQKWTRAGLAIRAASADPLLASQTGLRVERIFLVAFCSGAVIAAIAAMGYGYRLGASSTLIMIGLGALSPAVIGGLDSLGGVFAGAALAALTLQVAAQLLGGQAATVALFALVLLTLTIRPSGLFGTQTVQRA
ncbi:branched-chain amino acid ABC transporter permease [Conexibacter arvalis]|uniref:Branched-chain amino acid transport system permease protein n=1 Tax=Conexibacter arvalis TaxID=912552 RepID=A0A840I8P4_9ACTN|nr:branched-chain amino acid ABC transporter permease [Conexibacter arvalis]MBB4660641.1 branched-chain amino acid transport system permease protein [Conexibacter arvalis]